MDLLSTPAVITFSNHLTKPTIIDARLGGSWTIRLVQVTLDLGLGLGAVTPMWVYEVVDSTGQVVDTMGGMTGMPGMTGTGIYNPIFLASSGVPVSITWVNDLPTTGHLLPLDTSLLMGTGMGMGGSTSDPSMIPIVTHLHGAHVAAIYDGYPESTLLPGMSATYVYDNSQPGALLWYHDHSLGMTRLNVYAGLAGTYMLEDQNRKNLVANGVLPATLGAFETPLVIQDKSFKADGSLYYPAFADDPLPGTTDTVSSALPPDYSGPFPTAVPEFFGDTLLVNGQAWPHTHVGQGDILFDLLNGSDSRFYLLQLDNANVKVTLVGVDGGLLPKPIVIMDGDGLQEDGEQIVFAPADRLQLLFDFSNVTDGQKVHLLNLGAAFEPFKGLAADGTLRNGFDDLGNPVPVTAATIADSVGQIMEFRVDASKATFHSTITPDTVLNPNYVAIPESSADVIRKLGVFEYQDQFGRIMPLVGTAETKTANDGQDYLGGLGWTAPVTELVTLGATEVWEFYNVTADAHPIHLHQVQYQVLGRYWIGDTDTNGDGILLDGVYNNDLGGLIDTRPDLPGIQNLYPEDTGDQDTVWVGPGEALKIIMTFDRPGDYVWHCHILSHEDNDMMRPIKVIGVAGDFTGALTEDSQLPASGLVEIGRADSMLQGFIAGDLSGTAALGTLHLAANLTLPGGTAPSANNGDWTYSVGAAAQALAQGEIVEDVITIVELDGVTTHTITIEVDGINDAPIVAGAASLAGIVNVTRTITAAELLSRSSDIDHGAVLSVKGLTASSGILVDNGDGTWDYTADVNSSASVTFSYQVSDTLAETSATATLSLAPGQLLTVVKGTAAADNILGLKAASFVDGLAGDDLIVGSSANDVLTGGAGNDKIAGGLGADTFLATIGDGNDNYQGGGGIDTYDLSRTSAGASVDLGTGRSSSTQTGADKLDGIENIVGSTGNDILVGDAKDNILRGGAGDDVITGGLGRDLLTGNGGADSFVFKATGDVPVFNFAGATAASIASAIATTLERITDFHPGQDTIDLSAIDAITGQRGDQGFTWLGNAPLTAANAAGGLHYFYDAANDATVVEASINANLAPEFQLVLSGQVSLQAADFIL